MSSYLVIGGDARMVHLSSLLQKRHSVTTACMEEGAGQSLTDEFLIMDALQKTANVVLPIPYSKDAVHIWAPLSSALVRLADLFSRLRPGQTVFFGSAQMPDGIETPAKKVNFLECEKYAYANARETAEIALGLLIVKYRFSPYRKHILVLGYGRIAKILGALLKSLNAHVAIAARKEADIYLAASLGLGSFHIFELAKNINRFDCVVNTIPGRVIGMAELRAMRDQALLIDIASKPYGVDFEAASVLKKNVFLEQGLPGKYMPGAEAQALYKIITAKFLEG
jgi:dipicolinate synthase subunit A